MSKPREFWLMLAPQVAAVCEVEQRYTPMGGEQVHVIEKSAYDGLEKELQKRDANLKICEDNIKDFSEWNEEDQAEIDTLTKQADKLAEALEVIEMDHHPDSNMSAEQELKHTKAVARIVLKEYRSGFKKSGSFKKTSGFKKS